MIAQYAPADPERERQVQELGLTALHSIMVVAVVALLGVAGRLTVGNEPIFHTVLRLGWGIVGGLLVGLFLHLARYYDALAAYRLRRGEGNGVKLDSAHRWPRSSSDLDFLLQLVAALVVAAFA